MKMKKMMDVRNGKKVYFLGLNANGDKMWLETPSWDCGWYWSIGYVKSYQQNWMPSKARDIASHNHFDCLFPVWKDFVECFENTPFTKDERWKIYEYMEELYTFRHYADMMNYGGVGVTEGSNALKKEEDDNVKEYNRINNILIPNVWKELEAILI